MCRKVLNNKLSFCVLSLLVFCAVSESKNIDEIGSKLKFLSSFMGMPPFGLQPLLSLINNIPPFNLLDMQQLSAAYCDHACGPIKCAFLQVPFASFLKMHCQMKCPNSVIGKLPSDATQCPSTSTPAPPTSGMTTSASNGAAAATSRPTRPTTPTTSAGPGTNIPTTTQGVPNYPETTYEDLSNSME